MDPLQKRMIEKKVYEEIVNIVVDYVCKEFSHDEPARLRIYARIADNFDGVVRSLSTPLLTESSIINSIESEDIE